MLLPRLAQIRACGGEHVVASLRPDTLTAANAPIPDGSRVQMRQESDRVAVAVRCPGRWSKSAYRHQPAGLEAGLARAGLVSPALPRFARFG